MGSYLAAPVKNVMEEQKKDMKQMQSDMMERQMNMQNFVRENQMAVQVAGAREMFKWYGSFYALVLCIGIAGITKGKPMAAIPSLPLTWVTGYQYHFAYGNKMEIIREEAKSILADHKTKEYYTALPRDLPSIPQLDAMKK